MPWIAAQSPRWVQARPITSPSAKYGHAIAYDAARKQIVLFGGLASNQRVAETWLWDGQDWSQVHPPTSPSARSGPLMAYDSARQEILLWGGNGKSEFNDTWTWNGKSWTKEKPLRSPPFRSGARMAYDAARQQVVLFGGYRTTPYQDDTWTWDGKDWTKQVPARSPTGRASHSMAYDPARKVMVLFGGSRGGPGFLTDTWTWDGKTWTPWNPAVLPKVRPGAGMAYDPRIQRVVLFAQYDGIVMKSMTWLWDGKAWTEAQPASTPSWRSAPAMTYDAARKEILIYGGVGRTIFDETWTWNIHPHASTLSFGRGCGTFPGVILGPAPQSGPNIGESLHLQIRGLHSSTGSGVLIIGLSRSKLGPVPLPLDLTPFGMRGCHLYTSLEFRLVFPINSNSLGTYELGIPYHRALAGRKAFAQVLGVDRAANQIGWASSNGLELTFGSR